MIVLCWCVTVFVVVGVAVVGLFELRSWCVNGGSFVCVLDCWGGAAFTCWW